MISVPAANSGMPGMLGRFSNVNASTTVTNNEVETVPSQPQRLPIQIPYVKRMTRSPNVNV